MKFDKKSAGSAGPGHIGFELAELAIFFATSNFDLKYFCNFLSYKNVQYLIWKMWFISVWSKKPKVMLWLLRYVILAQSNLIFLAISSCSKFSFHPIDEPITDIPVEALDTSTKAPEEHEDASVLLKNEDGEEHDSFNLNF